MWQNKITLGFGDAVISKPLLLWINDVVMPIFFFAIGLEIKREIIAGDAERRATEYNINITASNKNNYFLFGVKNTTAFNLFIDTDKWDEAKKVDLLESIYNQQ